MVGKRINPGSIVVGLLLVVAVFAGMSAIPDSSPAPLRIAAPAAADAAERQLWGIKFTRGETNEIASAPAARVKQVLRAGGLASAVVATLYVSYRQAAIWSRSQGRCLGVTWIGSQVPGVTCP